MILNVIFLLFFIELFSDTNYGILKIKKSKGESQVKDKKIIGIVGVVFAILIIGAMFLGKNNFGKQKKKNEEPYMKAVYLKDEHGNSIFVETDTEMVFYGTIPQKLYDEKEKKITEEDLNSGDVVKIWGNEAIAQSYPAQYPGIVKMQREEKENKEYIEKYGHYLEEFIVTPDETEPPYLDISYKQPQALVTAAADMVTDIPVLKLSKIMELSVDKDTSAELFFSTQPQNIETVRWEADKKMEASDTSPVPEGEAVPAEKNEAGNWVITIQPGYIYQIKAVWENKEMEYGFSVTPMKTAE